MNLPSWLDTTSASGGPVASVSWLTATTALLAAIAATASAVAAFVTWQIHRRRGEAEAFFHISAQFESGPFREHRALIYGLDRSDFDSWTEDVQAQVNAWCAHLDVVATLVQAKQLNLTSLLQMYGDVIFRTVYQVAPYCNASLDERGEQFLLPIRSLTGDLLKLWRREARSRRYPFEIGFPAQPGVTANPDMFDADEAILRFRIDRGRLPQ